MPVSRYNFRELNDPIERKFQVLILDPFTSYFWFNKNFPSKPQAVTFTSINLPSNKISEKSKEQESSKNIDFRPKLPSLPKFRHYKSQSRFEPPLKAF